MQQLERGVQYIEQYFQRSLLFLALSLQPRLAHFNIPVAIIRPEEIVYLLRTKAQLHIVDIGRYAAHRLI